MCVSIIGTSLTFIQLTVLNMDQISENTPFKLGAPILLVLSIIAGFFIGYSVIFTETPTFSSLVAIFLSIAVCYFILGFLAKLVSREDSWHWMIALLLPSAFIFLLFIAWMPSRSWIFAVILTEAALTVYLGAQTGKRVRPNDIL